jgi:hypothetical protein
MLSCRFSDGCIYSQLEATNRLLLKDWNLKTYYANDSSQCS